MTICRASKQVFWPCNRASNGVGTWASHWDQSNQAMIRKWPPKKRNRLDLPLFRRLCNCSMHGGCYNIYHCLSIYNIHPSIHPSIDLSVYLSIYLHLHPYYISLKTSPSPTVPGNSEKQSRQDWKENLEHVQVMAKILHPSQVLSKIRW